MRLVSAATDTSRLVEIAVGSSAAAWERMGFAVEYVASYATPGSGNDPGVRA